MTRYVQDYHIVPLQIPIASAGSTAVAAINAVNMSYYNWAELCLQIGAFSTADATLTVLNSTAATTVSALAIPFAYRLSATVGADVMGALTTCDSGGLTLGNASEDDKMVVVCVDPKRLDSGYPWVRMYITHGSDDEMTMSAFAVLYPKYAQAANISST